MSQNKQGRVKICQDLAPQSVQEQGILHGLSTNMLWCHQRGLTEAGMTQFRWLKWPQTVDCCLAAVTCCQGVFVLRQCVAGSCFLMEEHLSLCCHTCLVQTHHQLLPSIKTQVCFFFSFCTCERLVSNGTSHCQHPVFHLGTACFTDR